MRFAFGFGADSNPCMKLNHLCGTDAGTEVLSLASPAQLNCGTIPIPYSIIADYSHKKDINVTGIITAEALNTAVVLLCAAYKFTMIQTGSGFCKYLSANNPGLVENNKYTVAFASNQAIGDSTLNRSKLNSAGFVRRYSVLQLWNKNGIPLSINTKPGRRYGINGQYVLRRAGSCTGQADCFSLFNYSNVGYSVETMIGVIKMTNYLKVIRETSNVSSNWTEGLLDFSIRRKICDVFGTVVPEFSAMSSSRFYRHRSWDQR